MALWRVLDKTTEKNETQSHTVRAIAAEPLGDPPVFSVR